MQDLEKLLLTLISSSGSSLFPSSFLMLGRGKFLDPWAKSSLQSVFVK